MTVSQALALGVLQGATEFLPVSSSGHLVLAENVIGGEQPVLLFDLVLHLATLLAIGLILRRRIADLLRAGLSLLAGGAHSDAQAVHRRWLLLVIVASVPTALIGLAMRGVVGAARHEPAWVGAALLVTAVLLFVAERVGRRSRGPGELGVSDAVLIGAAQGLAVMPGISRSGSTIAAALVRDTNAAAAVEFSMLISIPAIVGANILEFTRTGAGALEADVAPFAVGFLAAFLTGAASLKALQWLVARRHLTPFAVYCTLVGVGAIVLG